MSRESDNNTCFYFANAACTTYMAQWFYKSGIGTPSDIMTELKTQLSIWERRDHAELNLAVLLWLYQHKARETERTRTALNTVRQQCWRLYGDASTTTLDPIIDSLLKDNTLNENTLRLLALRPNLATTKETRRLIAPLSRTINTQQTDVLACVDAILDNTETHPYIKRWVLTFSFDVKSLLDILPRIKGEHRVMQALTTLLTTLTPKMHHTVSPLDIIKTTCAYPIFGNDIVVMADSLPSEIPKTDFVMAFFKLAQTSPAPFSPTLKAALTTNKLIPLRSNITAIVTDSETHRTHPDNYLTRRFLTISEYLAPLESRDDESNISLKNDIMQALCKQRSLERLNREVFLLTAREWPELLKMVLETDLIHLFFKIPLPLLNILFTIRSTRNETKLLNMFKQLYNLAAYWNLKPQQLQEILEKLPNELRAIFAHAIVQFIGSVKKFFSTKSLLTDLANSFLKHAGALTRLQAIDGFDWHSFFNNIENEELDAALRRHAHHLVDASISELDAHFKFNGALNYDAYQNTSLASYSVAVLQEIRPYLGKVGATDFHYPNLVGVMPKIQPIFSSLSDPALKAKVFLKYVKHGDIQRWDACDMTSLNTLYEALKPYPKLAAYCIDALLSPNESFCVITRHNLLALKQHLTPLLENESIPLKTCANVVYTYIKLKKYNSFNESTAWLEALTELFPDHIPYSQLDTYLECPSLITALKNLIAQDGPLAALLTAFEHIDDNKNKLTLVISMNNAWRETTPDEGATDDDRQALLENRDRLKNVLLTCPSQITNAVIKLYRKCRNAPEKTSFFRLCKHYATDEHTGTFNALANSRVLHKPFTALSHKNMDILFDCPSHFIEPLLSCFNTLYNEENTLSNPDICKIRDCLTAGLSTLTPGTFRNKITALEHLLKKECDTETVIKTLNTGPLTWPITLLATLRYKKRGTRATFTQCVEEQLAMDEHTTATQSALSGMAAYENTAALLADCKLDAIKSKSKHPLYQHYHYYCSHATNDNPDIIKLFDQWVSHRCDQIAKRATSDMTQPALIDLIAQTFGLASHLYDSCLSLDYNKQYQALPLLMYKGFSHLAPNDINYCWQYDEMHAAYNKPTTQRYLNRADKMGFEKNARYLFEAAYHPIHPTEHFKKEGISKPLTVRYEPILLEYLDEVNEPWSNYLLGLHYLGEIPNAHYRTPGKFERRVLHDEKTALLKEEAVKNKPIIAGTAELSDEEFLTIQSTLKAADMAATTDQLDALTLANNCLLRAQAQCKPDDFHSALLSNFCILSSALLPSSDTPSASALRSAGTYKPNAASATNTPSSSDVTPQRKPCGGAGATTLMRG